MKMILSLILLVGVSSAHAKDVSAIYSKEVESVLHKEGEGQVYKNGKALIRVPRGCALLRNEFFTESTERDILVIGYVGRATSNDQDVRPHSIVVGGIDKVLTEGGVIYDAATSETKVKTDDGVRYEVCYGKPTGAFASGCKDGDFESRSTIEISKKGVVMTSEYKLDKGQVETWKSTCMF